MKLKLFEVTDINYIKELKKQKHKVILEHINGRPHILVIINHQEYLIPLSTSIFNSFGKKYKDSICETVLENYTIAIGNMFPVAKGMYKEIKLYNVKNDTASYNFDRVIKELNGKLKDVIIKAELLYANKVKHIKENDPRFRKIYKEEVADFKGMEEFLAKYIEKHNKSKPSDEEAFKALGFKNLDVIKQHIRPQKLKYINVKHPKVAYRFEDNERTSQ